VVGTNRWKSPLFQRFAMFEPRGDIASVLEAVALENITILRGFVNYGISFVGQEQKTNES
jgi:hypothetical protein